MSDDGDCCYPIRDTLPPDAQAMTREQVEYVCQHAVIDGHYSTRVSAAYTIKEHDAAQRETIRQLNEAVTSGIRHRQEYVERIRSLQARLTASEAMVKEMEQACDQRKLTRKQQIEFDKIIGLRDREINTLRDRLARKTLKWTTARPTVAGMYWCDEYGPDIVRVRMHGDKLGVCISSTWYPIDSFTCRWQGPLTPGEE